MSKSKTKALSGKAQLHDVPEPVPIPADVNRDPESLLKLSCKLSLTSGDFIDTKFYAYTRRKSSSEVYAPQPIYANSYLLRARAPEYFEPLLLQGYGGDCIIAPLNGPFPDEFPVEASGCGHESDSDIEDDEQESDGSAGSGLTSTISFSLSSTTSPPAEDKKKGTDDDSGDTDDKHDIVTGNVGRIRLMRDFAYPTWKAFIFYLYTGDIAFAPLKSEVRTKPNSSDVARRENFTPSPPLCSPKSMYRLADELGLKDLKDRARRDIESKISEQNILVELFSSFTARYDEIRDMEVAYAHDSARGAVTRGIYEWMSSIPPDGLKHNAGVIAQIIQRFGGHY
ncbi:uncharacterized protein PHACADRAFT_160515 [Phanerochaete carnosa HHB-10118-sp]|uniref:BTB domain-containing protein n=1 Tax=Phanerochaete carnosa (strain HHB-10118-sp) TaxID=650164 RepID=K5WCJ0_PHACS|nr:uncharacterized protein PHACADRAFT_160515 [Phanerochaete carnosa HHB-10118-sp]EKM56960.1 hypothetical protein PHACADRAFT_160515 [Phanerochaete carnosa HHB-10118-sp]